MSATESAPPTFDAAPVFEGRSAILYHYAELLGPLRGLIAVADGELERRWRPAWRRFYRNAKGLWQDHYERLYAAALDELGDDSQATRELLESAIAASHARIAIDELMRPGATK